MKIWYNINYGLINLKFRNMKFTIKFILMLFLGGMFFTGCDSVAVDQLEFNDSSFKEVRMYLRELKDDHTSRKDLTISSTADKTTQTVTVIVKYTADITKLYGIATLERGANVTPIGDAPSFGTVGDYSTSHKYAIKSPDGGFVEWAVTVVLADPPPPVVGPSGFELVRSDGTNKHLPISTIPSRDVEMLGNARLGYTYNGSDQYASVDGDDINFRGTNDFSISFWVKTTATNSDPSMVGDKDWGGGANPGFVFAFTGGAWKLNAGGGGRIDIDGNPINDGKWHLLAATFDRDGNAILYEDGVALGSADISAMTNMDSGLPINIAQDGTGNYGNWFDGSIANVKLFDYVLSSNQVFNLASTGASLIKSAGDGQHFDITQTGGAVMNDFGSTKFGFTYDDSASQYSSISDGGALDFRHAGDFSVSCWVKTTATNSDPSIVGDKNWGSGSSQGFVLAYLGSNWKLNAGDGSNRIDITGNDINDDNWHLLVATFDRDGNATIFQDGVSIGTADMSGIGTMNSTFPINIAQEGTGSYGQWFQGNVANTMIFDYVLTSSQVTTLYNE